MLYFQVLINCPTHKFLPPPPIKTGAKLIFVLSNKYTSKVFYDACNKTEIEMPLTDLDLSGVFFDDFLVFFYMHNQSLNGYLCVNH